jgi:uncharacterized alpha-E superfamily protein
LGRLRSELDYLTIDDIMEQGLHEFLDKLQLQMNHVGDCIYETFFAIRPLQPSESPLLSQRQAQLT